MSYEPRAASLFYVKEFDFSSWGISEYAFENAYFFHFGESNS